MDHRYALALHGGAGTIASLKEDDPETAIYHAALREALGMGEAILSQGGSALDAVQATVVNLEDCPLFNAGRGSVYTAAATIEMDAAIMDGRNLAAGAIAGVRTIRNPICLARAVMDHSGHVLMVGEGAEEYAREQTIAIVSPEYFAEPSRLEQLDAAQKVMAGAVLDHDAANSNSFNFLMPPLDPKEKMGTVGAVARDAQGNLAAATSTGGLTNKRPGRVGDSPIIGAGCYASNKTAAISCTGTGEHFMRTVLAHTIAAHMEFGNVSLEEAAQHAVHSILSHLGGRGGLIAVDHQGNLCLPFNTTGMYRAWVRKGEEAVTAIGIETREDRLIRGTE